MTTPTASSYPQWETDLIKAMGFAPTPTTYQALNLWAASEGMAATANNPLAVCCHPQGSNGCAAQCSSSPIYTYPSRELGTAATASFMAGSNYGGIRAALSSPTATLADVYAAINSSKWCQGCQKGVYPTRLHSALNGASPTTIFRGAGGGAGDQTSATAAGASGATGCGAGSQGLAVLGAHIGTACQLKALVGGLCVGLGAGFLLVGTAILASHALAGTKTGRAVTGALPGPAKVVARRVTGTSSPRVSSRTSSGARSSTAPARPPDVSMDDVSEAYTQGERQGRQNERSEQSSFDRHADEVQRRQRSARPGVAPEDVGVRGRQAA